MKILVTGANGQVGHYVVEQLSKLKWVYKALTREELDITNQEQVGKIVVEFCPDVIINCAAYTAVDKAEANQAEAYAINCDGPSNLACAAKKNNSVLLHISTDYVFDGANEQAYLETDSTSPQSVYGASKLAGEKAIAEHIEKYIILRTSWVFGAHGNNFVKTMLRLGREKDSLGIVADQSGGPTFAGDIAKTLLELAHQYELKKNLAWGIYHFSGYPYVSWYEFAQHIFAEVNQQNIYPKSSPTLKAITTRDYPVPAKRPANSKLNCNKIQDNFNVSMSDWKSALKNIREYPERQNERN